MKYTLFYHFYKLQAADYIRKYRDPEKFLAFCRVCERYNKCWVCPPYEEDAAAGLQAYKYVYLIGIQIIPLQKERLYPMPEQESQKIVRHMLVEVRAKTDPRLRELEIEFSGSRAFYAGTCHLCAEQQCRKIWNLPCCHPDLIRPSLEALGFDLSRTAEELFHIPLKWGKTGEWPDYWMLISGFFTVSEVNFHTGIFE